MTTKILAYKNGSESARSLRDALGIKMLKKQGSKWNGKAGDTVINWGSSAPFAGNMGAAKYLNTPEAVARAANKLTTQGILSNDMDARAYRIPYVETRKDAEEAIKRGETIVCRTKLTGNSGDGIVIAEKVEDLVDAKLYTIYKKKQQEYRVHVFDGKVISVQRKARVKDVEDDKVNWQVRNLDGGFIFARTGFDVPRSVTRAAKFAVKALGLDFGAVDIGYHKVHGTFVYEVNTACGLSGSNLTDYVEAFCDKLNIPKPARPAEYVPPTIPDEGQEGVGAVALADAEVELAEEFVILSNEDVIAIVTKHGDNKAAAVREVAAKTGKLLGQSKAMVDRAAHTIAARAALAPKPEPIVEPVKQEAPAIDPRAPFGTKENPFGVKENGAELRQIKPDLSPALHQNTNAQMVRDYAGKWAWFRNLNPEIKYSKRIAGCRWSWDECHLVPKDVNAFMFELGNLKKLLNEEQQAKLVEFALAL